MRARGAGGSMGEHYTHNKMSLDDDPADDQFHLTGGREKRSERMPSYGLVILLGVLFLLAYLTSVIDESMPRVVTEDEAGYTRFSEERAWRYLREIVGDGPRVAGSPYHLQKTQDLKALVDQIAANATQAVRTDWQIVTDDCYIPFQLPYVNSYARASNVIALLEGESALFSNGTTNSSILLNCHYDTVPTSPGASDNALFCAVMMETLLLLSKREHKLKHNIIFLFNGAEENALQASHGFLSHPWAHGVTGLVNMDSAGMNGKSVLFQVTDPRVLTAYRNSVPRPSAHAIGEVLFTSGIVPSDTDFRVFRDFGRMYGIDIAFTRYGHVYHTRFDALNMIKPGVIQHAGDVIWHLAEAAGDMDEFSVTQSSPSTAVYWDYCYLFMASYSFTTAHIMDSFILLFVLSSVGYYLWGVGMRKRLIKELLFSLLSRIVALVTGAILVAIFTSIMVRTMPQLRYYSNPWLVVPMFWVLFLIGAVLGAHGVDWWRSEKTGLNRTRRTAQAMAATRLLWAIFLLVLLCLPSSVTMRYAITIPLFLTSLMAYVSLTVLRYWRLTAWQHLLMELTLSVPALLFIFSLVLKMDALMLPISGRSLSLTPDLSVAIINVAMAVLCCMPLAGVEILFSRSYLWIVAGAVGILSVILMFLPLQVYNADSSTPSPQRYNIFHVSRLTYNYSGALIDSDSGIWAAHTDVNSPASLLRAVNTTGMRTQTDFTQDCITTLYCNLPMVTPRTQEFIPFSVWIEFAPPAAFTPAPSLQLTSKTCDNAYCTLNFTVIGTPHVSFAIHPRPGVDLTAWSFRTPPTAVTERDGRPVYFLYHTHCTYSGTQPPLEVSLGFQITGAVNGLTEPLVDIAYSANKNHHESELTTDFRQFVSSLPEWFNVAPYISTRINYVY